MTHAPRFAGETAITEGHDYYIYFANAQLSRHCVMMFIELSPPWRELQLSPLQNNPYCIWVSAHWLLGVGQ